MILVSEGSRRVVLGPDSAFAPIPVFTPEPLRERCGECGSDRRMVVVSYEVFAFFRFGASGRRRYTIDCRDCRASIAPVRRTEFEREHGNAVPYGHRFGLAVLALLIAVTLADRSIADVRFVDIALVALWASAGIAFWRIAPESSFSRRRPQLQT